MAKTYYFYGHEGSEQGNAPHPEAHEQTVALITSSGSELVFQTHKDLGGVTYQIGHERIENVSVDSDAIGGAHGLQLRSHKQRLL